MPYKIRTKSIELKTLEQLNRRMKLNTKDKQHFLNLKKGYDGEVIFDTFSENASCECLLLNDLLLEVNHTSFQIDSLIISAGNICIYEVKNYEGHYFYESDKFYKKPKFEIVNPLDQASRSESLLRQLLHSIGFHLPIKSLVVFINPNFTLYQAPLGKPIIFQNQLKKHFNNAHSTPAKLTATHQKLAEQLLALHKTDSPYKKIPDYKYAQLRKGVICPKCQSLPASIGKRSYICNNCRYEEPLEKTILRGINEFKILFPGEKLRTRTIHDWCQVIPERRIRNTLLSNFRKQGTHRWTYFE